MWWPVPHLKKEAFGGQRIRLVISSLSLFLCRFLFLWVWVLLTLLALGWVGPHLILRGAALRSLSLLFLAQCGSFQFLTGL